MRRALPFLLAVAVAAQTPAEPRRFTLPCGLRVLLLEDHERPLVRAELSVDLDPPASEARPWLRDLAFTLLRHGGSGHRSHGEFEGAVGGLGMELQQEVQPLAVRWSLLARSRDQDLAMNLLADLVLRPAFNGAEVEQERGRYYDRITQGTPLTLAEEAFRRAQLGFGAPSEQAVGSLTTADFGIWHRHAIRPERATLVLYGDLDLAQARQLATLNLGTWSADPAPATAPASATRSGPPIVASLSGAATEVWAGLGPISADGLKLLPWAQSLLAAQGVELQAPGNLLTARIRGAVGEAAIALQTRLTKALASLAAGPGAQDLDRLRSDEQARSRLRPLHPAEWARELAAHAEVPTPDQARALAKGWSSATCHLWIGDPSALAGGSDQRMTPKREARSR